MWNIIKSIFLGYKIRKDGNNMEIITSSNLKTTILGSSVSLIGHIIIKRLLGTSIYGCIVLIFLEKLKEYYKYDFMKPIIELMVSSQEINTSINTNINSNINSNIEILTDPLIATAVHINQEAIDKIEIISDQIKNNTIGPITDTSINEYVSTGITGALYISTFLLILIVTGPAGAAGAATGVAVTKASSIGIVYVTSNTVIASVVSKTLGICTGLYVHHKIKNYINENNNENNNENDTNEP